MLFILAADFVRVGGVWSREESAPPLPSEQSGTLIVIYCMLHHPNGVLMTHIENCEGWLSPGGHTSGGRTTDSSSQRPSVQSQVAVRFLQVL